MQCSRYRDTFLTYVDDLLKTVFEPDYACAVLDALYEDMEKEYKKEKKLRKKKLLRRC
jgi:hypothetical protein